MSVLLNLVLLEWRFPTADQTTQSDVVPQAKSQPKQPPPPKVDALKQQLAELHRSYAKAKKFSVEQLTALEVSTPEGDFDPAINSFQDPVQYRIEADPTNYGDRRTQDVQGKLLHNKLLIVLHETTSSASAAVNATLTAHAKDDDQISYHAIIRQNGEILYLVDPLKRAYGAGDSIFKGGSGPETVQTNKNLRASVNNFAYHISLETPSDGYDDKPDHSGYSGAQYSSLAWLIARAGVKSDRITTHAAVDQTGDRHDPRSFEIAWLKQDLVLQTIDGSPGNW